VDSGAFNFSNSDNILTVDLSDNAILGGLPSQLFAPLTSMTLLEMNGAFAGTWEVKNDFFVENGALETLEIASNDHNIDFNKDALTGLSEVVWFNISGSVKQLSNDDSFFSQMTKLAVLDITNCFTTENGIFFDNLTILY